MQNEFPFDLFIKADGILQDEGMEAFRRYIKAVKMPREDIERILMKDKLDRNKKLKVKIDITQVQRKMKGMGEWCIS